MRDGHIHSPYCPHGSSDRFEQYIKKAIEVGVMVMTFTEHFPLPKNFKDPSPENDSAMSEDHLLAYFNELKELNNRIERLEKEEIIEGYEVKINQIKLGYHITAFINLEVAPVQKPEFYPFIKTCPNVVECNCVTGNYSMLLKVVFPSTMELDTFIGQLQKFGRTSTQIVFSTPVAPRGIDVNQELPGEEPQA